ncbi:MAG TPA: acetate--CoA ligase family protein, partial [Actinomycetota bacterium]|nr:acetate--CoA ligase family protein [Actinomycetota bacterium]
AAAGMTVVERPYRVEWNATGEQLAAVLSEALSAGDVHSVLVIHVPPVRAESDEINEVLHDAASTATKPLLAVLPHSTGLTGRSSLVTNPGPHGLPGPGSVPIFGEPAAAISALTLAVQHSAWLREPVGSESTPAGVDPVAAELIISARVGELLPNEDAMTTTGGPEVGGSNPEGAAGGGDLAGTQPLPRIHVLGSAAVLDQETTAELLGCYGLELWPHYPVHSEEEAAEIAARLGYPVVLKTLAHRLAHRADLGGVRLSLENERSLRTAYLSIAAQHPQDVREALVVQRMAPAGVACRAITREDPAFGPVMGFSIGGFMSDLIDDWTWWMPPLTGVEAAALVRAPKTAPLLFGYRGADHADVDALADVLHRVAALAGHFPQIAKLEINPILATSTGCYLLGAHAELATAVERQEVRPRRL